MTPENKEELNEANAEKLRMQICWNQADNCNKSVVVCNKINTQSEDKLNKTMAKCVQHLLGQEDAGLKRLSVSPNLFRQPITYLVSNANKRGRTGKTQNKCTINKIYYTPWKHFFLLFLLLSNWTTVQSASTEPSGIQIDPDDGGYTGVVFEIKEEVPEESCAEILKNVKVRACIFTPIFTLYLFRLISFL